MECCKNSIKNIFFPEPFEMSCWPDTPPTLVYICYKKGVSSKLPQYNHQNNKICTATLLPSIPETPLKFHQLSQ